MNEKTALRFEFIKRKEYHVKQFEFAMDNFIKSGDDPKKAVMKEKFRNDCFKAKRNVELYDELIKFLDDNKG